MPIYLQIIYYFICVSKTLHVNRKRSFKTYLLLTNFFIKRIENELLEQCGTGFGRLFSTIFREKILTFTLCFSVISKGSKIRNMLKNYTNSFVKNISFQNLKIAFQKVEEQIRLIPMIKNLIVLPSKLTEIHSY